MVFVRLIILITIHVSFKVDGSVTGRFFVFGHFKNLIFLNITLLNRASFLNYYLPFSYKPIIDLMTNTIYIFKPCLLTFNIVVI